MDGDGSGGGGGGAVVAVTLAMVVVSFGVVFRIHIVGFSRFMIRRSGTTYGRTYGRTDPLIEMRRCIRKFELGWFRIMVY